MNTLSGDIRDDSINKVSGIYSYQELSIGIRLFDYPRLGALDSDEIFSSSQICKASSLFVISMIRSL